MAEYQNIFTQVQVRGRARNGDGRGRGPGQPDQRGARFSTLAGWFGNAQLGPIYLGTMGVISLVAGAVWFMHRRRLVLVSGGLQPGGLPARPVLAVAGAAGAGIRAALRRRSRKAGYWLIASFFLLISVLTWWVRTYLRAEALGMGKHVSLGLCQRDLAVPGAGPVPADPDGSVDPRRCPTASSRTSTGPTTSR